MENLRKDAEVYFNQGVSYAKSEEYEKALVAYNKAIELDPKYPDVYYNRGICYRKLGEYDKAISDYSKSIELDPDDFVYRKKELE